MLAMDVKEGEVFRYTCPGIRHGNLVMLAGRKCLRLDTYSILLLYHPNAEVEVIGKIGVVNFAGNTL